MNPQKYSSAEVITRTVSLTEEGRELLRSEWSPRECLDALREARLHVDCLKYLPHLLDRRCAVWWACICCFDAYRDEVTPELGNALSQVVRWVHEPTDSNRRACLDGDDSPDVDTSENCLRMAVVWSGGSMLAADLPEVLPPPDVTPQLSAGAVLLAAASRGIYELAACHHRYVHLGYGVLEGRLPWARHAERRQPAAATVVIGA
jgi:hypothetical protein